jgi:FkbM family methyltransferase
MAESKPANLPTAITVNHNGKSYVLRFFDDSDVRQGFQQLFSGNEYPILPVQDYQPAVILDIGANVGAAALYMHLNYPHARIYCFEPSPTNLELLKTNLSFSDRFTLINCGLLDRSEQLKLFTGKHHTMTNSFMPGPEVGGEFELAEVRSGAAELTRLGIDAISIIKLDTEGCEMPILRDIRPWLGKTDLIYVEYHNDDDRRAIDRLLEENFILGIAKSPIPHRGTCMYISRDLLKLYPILDRAKIETRSSP